MNVEVVCTRYLLATSDVVHGALFLVHAAYNSAYVHIDTVLVTMTISVTYCAIVRHRAGFCC